MKKTEVTVSIVVMDKGFVSIGVLDRGDVWCTLDNAQVIRCWGTNNGLGEIAIGGPTSKTKLDPTPRETIPTDKIIKVIDCDASKWKKVLGL